MRVSPIGPFAANPTKGELLPQLGMLSRKLRSVKRKTSGSTEKDRPVLAKVQKLGASSSSPSTHIRKPERAHSPSSKTPTILSSQPRSRPAAKEKSLLGGAIEQPLAIMPITVWNPPTRSVRSPSRKVEELKRKDLESKSGEDGDSLLHNAELVAGAVSSILKDSDLERSNALPVDEALALSLQGVAPVSSSILSCLFPFDLNIGLVLDVDSMLDVQVATHLKGLAKKAKLNERHVKAARVYKARVASLTSERTKLQERVQRMTKEMERLKFDLKHTMSARVREEIREDEVRNSLTAVEGELQEVRDELGVAQNDLAETRDGLQSIQYELRLVRDELITSQGELRESKEELRAANGELRDKVALLDVAPREASEAVNSTKRLNEECHGLRGDLHQQITLIAQRDEVIGRLRDQASA